MWTYGYDLNSLMGAYFTAELKYNLTGTGHVAMEYFYRLVWVMTDAKATQRLGNIMTT